MFAYTPAEPLINSPFVKASFLLCCVLTLAACGGGGGSDTPANNNAINQPPTNVVLTTVQASSSDVIDVAWSLAKDDKTIANTLTYQVHLSETAGFSPSSETLKFSQKGAVATQLTGLKPVTAYRLKLVVIDDDGAQTVSAEKTVTTPNINVVNQSPTNVALTTVQATSPTGVTASWSTASDDTTTASQLTYEVHMAEGGDFTPSGSSLKFSGKNVLTTQVTGLKAATTYTVKLVAIDAQGLSSTSSGLSVTTQNVVAVNKAPTNVALTTVQATSPTGVTASWSTASDDTTTASQLTYEVHMAEGGDFTPSGSSLKFSGKNVLTTQVTGLKAATTYTVKLVAIDAQGLSSTSSGLSVTTHTVMQKLNDTGITKCSNENTLFADCSAASMGGWFGLNQDGEVGRDFLAINGQLTKVGAGDAGFDFTKISATGDPLPASATQWSCVKDNHTGLMWEVKTDDGGLRDKDNTYSWYNPDTSTNGGFAGNENEGNNTQAFAQAVNSQIQPLCGHRDWRLPNKQELHSIINYGKYHPSIDETYFPNTKSFSYVSSSLVAYINGNVWTVDFNYGYTSNGSGGHVRLVR